MSLQSRFIKFLNKFEDLFLTNHACLCCRKEIPDGTEFSLCENCLNGMEKLKGNLCKTCGEKILEGNTYCDRCKLEKYNFSQSRSFAVYDDISSKIVKRFKYNGKKYYAENIAKLMAENGEYFENIDYLTFVPIGKERRRERGFNQAEEIAKVLSEIKSIPVVEFLEKTGSEKHQAGLSQKDRQKNLSGTIVLNEDNKNLLKGKNILIIDDVFTTGATLSECARVLKSQRANKPNEICCYTFAKTILNSTNNGQNQQNNRMKNQIKSN